MFAFDQWHVFITNAEIMRALGVELLVVYVQSVHPSLFNIIKAYEEEGFVQLRGALHMPRLDSMAYNPNAETMWNNQLVNFHDAYYYFRESTDFIVFNDWDELLITPDFQPLAPIFQRLKEANPDVAAFNFQRINAMLPTISKWNSGTCTRKLYHCTRFTVEYSANMMHRNLTLYSMWDGEIFYDGALTPMVTGKMAMRPLLADGVGIHYPSGIKGGAKQMTIPADSIYMLHIRERAVCLQ